MTFFLVNVWTLVLHAGPCDHVCSYGLTMVLLWPGLCCFYGLDYVVFLWSGLCSASMRIPLLASMLHLWATIRGTVSDDLNLHPPDLHTTFDAKLCRQTGAKCGPLALFVPSYSCG